MGTGGAIFALTAAQAVSQISQGYAEKAEANYNANIMQQQAGMIDIQKDIEYGQYQRLKGRTMSTSMANVAKAGIMPQGSAMAVMVNTQAQIAIDQAIGQYNFNMEKNYKMAEADAMRRRGKLSMQAGWSNGFTTALKGYAGYKMYTGGLDAKRAGSEK
jgi:hypothetical protein